MQIWYCGARTGENRRLTTETRRDLMGDKGGKKDKEKGQKQDADKKRQEARRQQEKQPKRKPG